MTTQDVATPSDFATEKLLPSLPNGKQMILKDYSHTLLSGKQAGAVFNMVFNFYTTGKVDDSGIVHEPIKFAVKKSLNSIAKKNYLPLLFKSVF